MTITLLVVVAVLAVLSFATLQKVVAPAFDKLELDEARTNLIRAQRAIRNDLDNLSAIADSAEWAFCSTCSAPGACGSINYCRYFPFYIY